MWADLLLIMFLLCTLCQLLIWSGLFSRLVRHQLTTPVEEPDRGLSLVLCARDEEKKITQNLPHLLNQEHHSLEIVVVNDRSRDTTAQVLLEFKKISRNIVVVEGPAGSHTGKKKALAKGILSATHEAIILTDADCYPACPHWARLMQSHLRGNIKIGLAYGAYERRKGFLNRLIRYETVYTAVQYFSFALAGCPYMGVGRNLIYQRTLFEQAGGFDSHEQLASGDDDLFINQVASSDNTCIILEPDTFTYSSPKSSWRGYYQQKSRHVSTGTSYRWQHQLGLGLIAMSYLGHYACLMAALIIGQYVWIILSLYLVRIGVVWHYQRSILRRLREEDLILWLPLLDFSLSLFHFLLLPALIIPKRTSWK